MERLQVLSLILELKASVGHDEVAASEQAEHPPHAELCQRLAYSLGDLHLERMATTRVELLELTLPLRVGIVWRSS